MVIDSFSSFINRNFPLFNMKFKTGNVMKISFCFVLKDADHEMDDEELEEEERKFETAFSSFMDALDKAENKLSTVSTLSSLTLLWS